MNRFVLLFAIVALSSGCSRFARIQNPDPTIREVSLVPVATDSLEHTTTWTRALQRNLLRVKGVDRVSIVDPPLQAESGHTPFPMLSTSQGLIQVEILSFEPYYPPSATVQVNFYAPNRMQPETPSGVDLDRLGRLPTDGASGSERRLSFQLSVRTDDYETMTALWKYGLSAADNDRGCDMTDRILRNSDRFIDFVAFQCLRESFSRLADE